MGSTLKAIETQYKGYRFRSRLEARWAVFFDALKVQYEYEKEGFDLGEAGWYLPDFFLPEYNVWVEIKGDSCSTDEWKKVHALMAKSGKTAFIVIGSIGEHKWNQVGPVSWQHVTIPVILPNPDIVQTVFIHQTYDTDSGAQVICPVCGFDYVHFEEAMNIEGEDNYAAWSGRGDAIRIPMWCENGHTWTLRFGFHKGFTFAAIEDAKEEVEDFQLVLAGLSSVNLNHAIAAARSARFEHGERG